MATFTNSPSPDDPSLSNWGRWGWEDQRGAINLVDAAKIAAAAREVRQGRSISLSRPMPFEVSPDTLRPGKHVVERIAVAAGGGYAADFIAMEVHGIAGTHIDALCHVWGPQGMWNGRSPDVELSTGGSSWGGIEQWTSGIVTRGVLLDVVRHRGGAPVTAGSPVTAAELHDVAQRQGIAIEPGDAVAIHCGRDLDPAARPWGSYPQTETGHPQPGSVDRPGLHESCVYALRDWDVAVLVWDMLDAAPHERNHWGVHAGVYSLGLGLVDNARLDELSRACAELDRSTFMFVVAPLHLRGGTGSPVNPLAIL